MRRFIIATFALIVCASGARAADLIRGSIKDDIVPIEIEVCNCWGRWFGSIGIAGHYGGGVEFKGKGFHTTNDIQNYDSINNSGGFWGRDSSSGGVDIGVGASLGFDKSFGRRFFWGGVADLWYAGRRFSRGEEKSFPWTNNHQLQVASYKYNQELAWLSTARLRLGLVHDRYLLYVTGGAALGSVRNSAEVRTRFEYTDGVNAVPQHDMVSGTNAKQGIAFGYAVGAGGEWSMTQRLSIGVEYLYYALSDDLSFRSGGIAQYAGLDGGSVGLASDLSGHSLRLNVIYQVALD